MDRKQIKTLIELSGTFKEADEVIVTYAGLDDSSDVSQKLAYLKGMFDCQIVGRSFNDVEADYVALLTSIIEQKWK